MSIRALAAAGTSNNEIAERFGLNKSTVSEILNSEETKQLVALGDSRLKGLMTKAIDTIEWAMDNRQEYGLAGASLKAAITVLKNMGLARENVDVNHHFPKPTVIKRRDGTEVIMGTTADLKDED
jgi:hypothetical protein